ncbi:hypothetical protein Pmani_013489 [Petrolisthes manimaculis]|uniref:Uncharacterized protein n=1 Tax=Petrolisthes manimaculis TaxID=1843537 RepID=A0AAE1PVJ3_9EUCA|nr:hypothetical protein Pmani_013489 [Petrolisthes manimaculis]
MTDIDRIFRQRQQGEPSTPPNYQFLTNAQVEQTVREETKYRDSNGREEGRQLTPTRLGKSQFGGQSTKMRTMG